MTDAIMHQHPDPSGSMALYFGRDLSRYLHRWAVLRALRWRSSKKEKSFRTDWQRLASLKDFGAIGVDHLGS